LFCDESLMRDKDVGDKEKHCTNQYEPSAEPPNPGITKSSPRSDPHHGNHHDIECNRHEHIAQVRQEPQVDASTDRNDQNVYRVDPVRAAGKDRECQNIEYMTREKGHKSDSESGQSRQTQTHISHKPENQSYKNKLEVLGQDLGLEQRGYHE